jgi:hypothetical protein
LGNNLPRDTLCHSDHPPVPYDGMPVSVGWNGPLCMGPFPGSGQSKPPTVENFRTGRDPAFFGGTWLLGVERTGPSNRYRGTHRSYHTPLDDTPFLVSFQHGQDRRACDSRSCVRFSGYGAPGAAHTTFWRAARSHGGSCGAAHRNNFLEFRLRLFQIREPSEKSHTRFRDDHVVRRHSPCSGRSRDRGIACFILPIGLVPCLIVLSDIVRLDCRIYRIRLALENRFPCPGFHLCLRESRHRCFCRLVGWRRNPFPKNSYGCRIDGGRCCGHHISQSRTKSFNGKKRVRKGHRSQIPANRTGCPKIMLEHKEEKCQKRFQCIMRLQPSSCCAC